MSRAAQIRLDVLTREGEAGLERLERQAIETKRSFERLDRETDDLERSQKRLGMTAGQTANALKRTGRSGRTAGRLLSSAAQGGTAMSGTLTTLIPQLGGAAMVLGEAASAAEMFAGAGAAALRVLGPIAIAALAAGGAYAYFSSQLKEAEARQKLAADATIEATAANKAFADGLAAVSLEAAIADGTIDQYEANRLRASGQLSSSAQASILLRKQALKLAAEEARIAQETLTGTTTRNQSNITEGQRRQESGEGLTRPMQAAINVLATQTLAVTTANSAVEVQQGLLDGINAKLEEGQKTLSDTADYRRQIAADSSSTSKSTADTADAAERELKALSDLSALRDRKSEEAKATIIVGMGLASQDRPSALSLKEASTAHLAGVPLDDEFIAEQRDARAAGLVSGAQAASSVMSGDVMGLVGMGGSPGGAAASAIIAGLSALGDKGADGIIEAIESQARLLVDGIGELPELLEAIPELLMELFPDLIKAIGKMVLMMVPTMLKAIWSLIQGIGEFFKDLFGLGGKDERVERREARRAERDAERDASNKGSQSGLTSSDAETARVLQTGGGSSSGRGGSSSRSSRSGSQRGDIHSNSGGTTIVNNGPVLSSPLTAWHGDMDARFGANGWDRKPNYTGGPL